VKKALTIALTVVFILSLAAPAFAMTHDAVYEWDGTAETFERQVGHWCNTGAEQKVEITGDGQMSRISDVTMSKGKLTVDEDRSEFVTAEDATNNLTITSVIDLCAPPKAEFTTTHYVPVEALKNPPELDEVVGDCILFDEDDEEWKDWRNSITELFVYFPDKVRPTGENNPVNEGPGDVEDYYRELYTDLDVGTPGKVCVNDTENPDDVDVIKSEDLPCDEPEGEEIMGLIQIKADGYKDAFLWEEVK